MAQCRMEKVIKLRLQPTAHEIEHERKQRWQRQSSLPSKIALGSARKISEMIGVDKTASGFDNVGTEDAKFALTLSR